MKSFSVVNRNKKSFCSYVLGKALGRLFYGLDTVRQKNRLDEQESLKSELDRISVVLMNYEVCPNQKKANSELLLFTY